MRRLELVTAMLVTLILAACGGDGSGQEMETASGPGSSEIVVFTVNYPLAYFAKRVGGERVQVEFPAPPDVDPAFWAPEISAVSAYQSADLILLNGAGYARWVDRATLPSSRMVDTSAAFRERLIAMDNEVVHTHGPEGDHTHGALAFTTWLDFELAVGHAKAIRDALVELRPDLADEFEAGFRFLEEDLLGLDRALRELVTDFQEPVVASHPVYQYLAARHGLNLASVHFEPDEYPDTGAWQELESLLKAHPARWMIWESEPLVESVARLRDLGIESVVFNPCGNAPPNEDFLSVMKRNLDALAAVVE